MKWSRPVDIFNLSFLSMIINKGSVVSEIWQRISFKYILGK